MITRRLVLLRYWKSVLVCADGFSVLDVAYGPRARVATDGFSIYDAATHS